MPENCHIAMLHRGASTEELLWQYSRARNWNAVPAMLPDVDDPALKQEAAQHLIRWLRLDAEKGTITANLAKFRLGQLSELLSQADQESDSFRELEDAVAKVSGQREG